MTCDEFDAASRAKTEETGAGTTTFTYDDSGSGNLVTEATGFVALITATGATDPSAQGSRATHTPIGWPPGNEVHRGHVIAKAFGGDGSVDDIVAMYAGTNGITYNKKAVKRVRAEVDKRCSPVLVAASVAHHDQTETVEELWTRGRLPADPFTCIAVHDTGPGHLGPNPILDRP